MARAVRDPWQIFSETDRATHGLHALFSLLGSLLAKSHVARDSRLFHAAFQRRYRDGAYPPALRRSFHQTPRVDY